VNTWKLPELRIDSEGDWFDGDEQVTHPGILANLRGTLRKDADGYYIQTSVRIPVKVDEAPFVIIRIERRADELHAYLNDGTDERVDPASIRLGEHDVPYAAVKGGAFEARCNRAAAWQLLQIAEYDEVSGTGALRLRGGTWPLRRAS